MPAGRPRTVSLSPEEMIELGKEMVEWVMGNNPIHLSMWYCIEKGYTESEWDTMSKKPEFVQYYEQALKLVGYNYISKNSDVEPSIKQRWQRVYFKDLKAEENETKAYEARLKAQADLQAHSQYVAQHVMTMDYLERMRQKPPAQLPQEAIESNANLDA